MCRRGASDYTVRASDYTVRTSDYTVRDRQSEHRSQTRTRYVSRCG